MYLKVEGPTTLDYWGVYAKVLKHNQNVEHLILDAYYDLAKAWGMDAAALIAQAIHETGWFTSFRAVVNHNYAGIGATSDSVVGKVNKCIIEVNNEVRFRPVRRVRANQSASVCVYLSLSHILEF